MSGGSGGSAAAASRRAPAAAAGGGALELSSGSGSGVSRGAAGAVAAAARELRPVELVGLYEVQKEALEKELAASKAEVRRTNQCISLIRV